MSSNKTEISFVGFPIGGILGLIFVTLKLCGIGIIASWSWLWVLSPFWIPLIFVLGILLFAAIGFIIVFLASVLKGWVKK